MLSEKTLEKIKYEYQHGGVQNYHPEISLSERKALLRYLFSLPTKCEPTCEATHTAQVACRLVIVGSICQISLINKTKGKLNENNILNMARLSIKGHWLHRFIYERCGKNNRRTKQR